MDFSVFILILDKGSAEYTRRKRGVIRKVAVSK